MLSRINLEKSIAEALITQLLFVKAELANLYYH